MVLLSRLSQTTNVDTVHCPDCEGAAHRIGPLPGSNLFAGRNLDEVLPGGTLYRCGRCLLGFRLPRLEQERLNALYAAGSSEHWQYAAADRPDWVLAAREIAQHASPDASVLDLGCFDGAFLDTLGPRIRKAGIEIMPEAAQTAQQRGVEIIGADFDALDAHPARFDIITAFDVIEHVPRPRSFVQRLRRALRPGGLLIVSTGNLDAWTWRLMRSRYWYCAIPEHISFVSERWFNGIARPLHFELIASRQYAHAGHPPLRRLREALANVAFLAMPGVIAGLRRRKRDAALHPALAADYPPVWHSARDHILITARCAPVAP